jgi:general stress protein 26
MSVENWLAAARATMESAEYCFLITLGESGGANARLMQPFKPEEDLTIWFGASPRSRKVRELGQDDRATVAYQNTAQGAYVTLRGRAQIVRDVALRKQYWRRRWSRFWPDGPEGHDYVLIRFVPSRVELMNTERGIMPDAVTQPAVLLRQGEAWIIGGGLANNAPTSER